ncbi:flagellar hook-length control protein FliK [Aeromonas enteropelogenes]|uniref:flagellar hook-length control protein FliK n=1 Tax=Aeromonas enteropelogenes TaxID=29489 RepID=UPI003B9E00FE
MIQFSGVNGSPVSEQTGFRRSTRQSDEQGGMYSPLDLPLEADPSAQSVQEDVAERGSVTEESSEHAAEQLTSFSNMPPAFVLNDVVARLLADGQVSLSAREGEDAIHTRFPSISAALRTLSAYGRPDSEKGQVMEQLPLSKEKALSLVADVPRLIVREQATQAGEQSSRDKLIGSLLPLLGGDTSADRESGVPDFKGVMGNLVPLPVSKPAEYQWAPVRLADNPASWGQQLVDVLRDKVELQVNQQVKQAHIRLDPPELGRLELTVRVDGDRLNVQLNVTNPAVRDALIQSMERLRMSLAPHHAGGVEVNVGQGERQSQQETWQQQQIMAGRRQWQEELEPADGAIRDWLNTLV